MNSMKHFFDSEFIKTEYQKLNYKIEYDESQEEKTAVIYFSSNGLYYPNNQEVFNKKIVEKDYYEWTKNKIKAHKHIFIRDIYKQWYVCGINDTLNCVEKLRGFLKSETEGYKVVTVGSSAGGYAAILLGCLLNAEYVLAFAAQFTLHPEIEKQNSNLLIKLQEKDNKYYELMPTIEDSGVRIYYFSPSRSQIDIPHLQEAEKLNNVKTFRIRTKHHGMPMTLPCLTKVIEMNSDRLSELHESLNEKEVNGIWFSFKIGGIYANLDFICKFIYKKIQRKIKEPST